MDPPCTVSTESPEPVEGRKRTEEVAMDLPRSDHPDAAPLAAAAGPTIEPVGCLGHSPPLTATMPLAAATESPTPIEDNPQPQPEVIGTLTPVSDGPVESVPPPAAAETA